MVAKAKLFNHFKALRHIADKLSLDVCLDCLNFELTVKKNSVEKQLFPQFVSYRDGYKLYEPDFSENIINFCGWRPYKLKPVPLLVNNIEFKEFLKLSNCNVPEYSFEPMSTFRDVVVKKTKSSFGEGIHGPFRSSFDYKISDDKSEYYEKFIKGNILKIWAIRDVPICVEIQAMPQIKGNGSDTIEQILEKRTFIRTTKINYQRLNEVLDYFDLNKDKILADGEYQMVDFRYASPLARRNAISDIPLPSATFPLFQRQLKKVLTTIWKYLEKNEERDLVYTIDGILEDNEKLWVLEANANPIIHPMVYPHMLSGLFGKNYTYDEVVSYESI